MYWFSLYERPILHSWAIPYIYFVRCIRVPPPIYIYINWGDCCAEIKPNATFHLSATVSSVYGLYPTQISRLYHVSYLKAAPPFVKPITSFMLWICVFVQVAYGLTLHSMSSLSILYIITHHRASTLVFIYKFYHLLLSGIYFNYQIEFIANLSFVFRLIN